MIPDPGEHAGSEPLAALNALAREARDSYPDPTPAERSEGWAKVATRVRRQDARRRTLFRYSAAGLVTAAAVAGALALLPVLRPKPAATLAYEIRGGSVGDGGYLRESGSDGIKLRFVEGTEVSLAAGTRGRLRSVSSTGARIALEHGKARFHITPRPKAAWSVEAGPFVVNVKGTTFTVAWDAVTELLDLNLESGLVSVTGPVTGGAVLLKGGQHLAVDLHRKETVITEASPEDARLGAVPPQEPATPGIDAGEGLPALAPGEPEARAPTARARVERTAPEPRPGTRRGWAQAVASGDWDRILADVDGAGVSKTLAQASSDDLLAVADAARYRRRADLSRAALLAVRRRFPGEGSACVAAYLLGRLAEARHGGSNEALQWYDTYLTGAPAGPYASDALGRKMMAIHQLHGAAEARALAREYLRRYPSDSYAGAARALLISP